MLAKDCKEFLCSIKYPDAECTCAQVNAMLDPYIREIAMWDRLEHEMGFWPTVRRFFGLRG
jgi:hypothetical protein